MLDAAKQRVKYERMMAEIKAKEDAEDARRLAMGLEVGKGAVLPPAHLCPPPPSPPPKKNK